MEDLLKLYDGVFQCQEKTGLSEIEYEGRKLNCIMDYFYIDGPADELSHEQVSALCHARAKKSECLEGANRIIKTIFKHFLISCHAKNILEIGAGENPVLTPQEANQHGIIQYITADLDNYTNINIQFTENSQLNAPCNLDIIIALFVLHFRFYESQVREIFLHLKENGIFLANIYNRSDMARERLRNKFLQAGFCVELIKDPNNECRNHYYLFAAKNEKSIIANKALLIQAIKEKD